MKHLFSQHLYWVLSALLLSVVICEDDTPRLPTTNAKSPLLRRFESHRKPQKDDSKKPLYSQPPDDPTSTTSVSLDWKDVAQNSNRTLDHLSRNTVPVYAPTEPTGKLARKNGSPGPGPLLAFKSVTTRTFPEGESIPPTGWALASLKNTIRPYNPTKRPLTTPSIKPISDYWSNRLAKTTTPSTFFDIQQDATASTKSETDLPKNATEESTEKTNKFPIQINATDLDTIIKNVSTVENLVKEVKVQNGGNETIPVLPNVENIVSNEKNETKIDQSTTSMTRATNVTNIPTEKTSTEAIIEKNTEKEQLTTIGNDIPDVSIKYKNFTILPILNDKNLSVTTILPFPTMNATSEILTTLSQVLNFTEENTTEGMKTNFSLSPLLNISEMTTQISTLSHSKVSDENTTVLTSEVSKNVTEALPEITTPGITVRMDVEETTEIHTTISNKNSTLPNSIIEETTISLKEKRVTEKPTTKMQPQNETSTINHENITEKTIFENNDIKLRITTQEPTTKKDEVKISSTTQISETTEKVTRNDTTEPTRTSEIPITTERTTEKAIFTTENATVRSTEQVKTTEQTTEPVKTSSTTTTTTTTTTEIYLSVPTKNLSGFHYDVENKTESTPIIFRETVDIDEEDSLLYNTTSNDKNDDDDDEGDEMDKETEPVVPHTTSKASNDSAHETPKTTSTPSIKKIPETTTEIDETIFDTGVVIPMDVELIVQAMYSEMCDERDELKDSIVKLFKTYAGKTLSPKQVVLLDLGPQECYENNELMYVSPAQIHLRMTDQNGQYSKPLTELLVGLIRQGHFQFKFPVNRVDTLVSHQMEMEGQLGGTVIAAIVISSIAAVSLLFLTILLVIMRKRQKGFNYGQRCTPVSLDDYSLDNISVYNSVRRKALRASKRSYGNPAFDDPAAISLPLNFAGLSNAVSVKSKLEDEFSKVPTVTVKPDELPLGAEIKNRYANVIPLPETQVHINSSTTNDVIEQFINANYVKGAKGSDKFYIACQAPLPNTIADFWQMIWEQQSKIIIMLTNLHENGVEKCADYMPPSEVLDCHRVFGDLQITLKKREAREKYIISNLQIKNLETNLWREVTHMWYTSWPARGVPDDTSSIIAFLIEARSFAKSGPPVVVHCSPGTGRTGTIIAIDIAIRDFETDRIVDIPKTVYAIRKERAGAVQTSEQYRLIYEVLHLYATKLTGGGLDSI